MRASFFAYVFEFFVDFVCFQTLKNKCFFVERIAILRFSRFLLFPLPLLSETSFLIHVTSSFDLKNRPKPFPDERWKNDVFLITFFFTILVILGSLGRSQESPRGRHFRFIFALFGVQGAKLLLHAPSGASLDDFLRFGLF